MTAKNIHEVPGFFGELPFNWKLCIVDDSSEACDLKVEDYVYSFEIFIFTVTPLAGIQTILGNEVNLRG